MTCQNGCCEKPYTLQVVMLHDDKWRCSEEPPGKPHNVLLELFVGYHPIPTKQTSQWDVDQPRSVDTHTVLRRDLISQSHFNHLRKFSMGAYFKAQFENSSSNSYWVFDDLCSVTLAHRYNIIFNYCQYLILEKSPSNNGWVATKFKIKQAMDYAFSESGNRKW